MEWYKDLRNAIHQSRLAREWEASDKSEPPPHLIKRRQIVECAKAYHCDVFVETGTYLGDMVYALRCRFRRIFSIELEPSLFEKAKRRFAKLPHITVLHGDSAKVLPSVLREEQGRILFWLDGHYSGGETAKGERETPIIEELKHIKAFCDSPVILIDDARLFVGENDYPTLERLQHIAKELWPDYQFGVRDDVVCVAPSRRADA